MRRRGWRRVARQHDALGRAYVGEPHRQAARRRAHLSKRNDRLGWSFKAGMWVVFRFVLVSWLVYTWECDLLLWGLASSRLWGRGLR